MRRKDGVIPETDYLPTGRQQPQLGALKFTSSMEDVEASDGQLKSASLKSTDPPPIHIYIITVTRGECPSNRCLDSLLWSIGELGGVDKQVIAGA